MKILEELGLLGGHSLAEQIRLESAEDEYTLTTKEGILASAIWIDGAMQQENKEDLAAVVNELRVTLSPLFSRLGHALEVIFSRDPSAATRQVEQILERQKRRAAELELDLSDIFDGAASKLSRTLIGESCIAVIYTRYLEDSGNTQRKLSKLTPEEQFLDGNPHPSITDDSYARHQTLTDAVCRDLELRGRNAHKLSIVQALREIRAFLYPFSSPWKADWTPTLPIHLRKVGNNPSKIASMPNEVRQFNGLDYSNLDAPTFDQQLAVEEIQSLKGRIIRIGDTIFSGFDVTVAPEILVPFDELVAETMSSPIPLHWRCRFLIEPGGLQSMRLKEQFARLFAFAAPVRNIRIRDSLAALREIDGAGDTVVRLRISFATWTRTTHEADLRRKIAILQRAAEQWGNLSTDGVSADPLTTVLSTSASLGPVSTAPAAAAPLSASLALLPISRQSSPWTDGPVTFRTEDGKIWPYWPGSSRQNSWVEIYCGTPGSGKSVAMHAINRSFIVAPHGADSDVAELPLIAVLDIGRSSKGFIDLIKGGLPAHKRDEVAHLKMRMLPDYAINPFDTPLGLRRPLAAGRSFMVNFLAVLCGSSEMSTGCPVVGLASASLDHAFDTLADGKTPKRYVVGDEPEVDKELRDIGHDTSPDASWWEITDALFSAGRSNKALMAQRRAVPVLSDLVTASCADHVASLYSEANINGESVIKKFHRQIAEAIRDFRIIASPTKFDVGPARIAALDLEEVAGAQIGISGLRQTSLMYMLARQALTVRWFLDEDEIGKMVELGFCPLLYKDFHVKHAQTHRKLPKLLCIDEFHRTGGLAGFERQILQDIREGRKNNVRVALASQLPTDFSGDILDVATTLFIFDAPSESSSEFLAHRFRLSLAEKNILSHRLTGPRQHGAPLFAVIRHKQGVTRQLLYLTLGQNELWALSTTLEDTVLRDGLSARIGPKLARIVLSNRFPEGTAKAEIENRIVTRDNASHNKRKGNAINSLIEEIVEEVKLARSAKLSDCIPPEEFKKLRVEPYGASHTNYYGFKSHK